MSEGYIYILINASLQKGFLKIGMTTRNPEFRARQLSEDTGLPSEYLVAYEKKVSNCEVVERLVHKKLREHRITQYRIDREREFFNIPLKKAIATIETISEDYELVAEENLSGKQSEIEFEQDEDKNISGPEQDKDNEKDKIESDQHREKAEQERVRHREYLKTRKKFLADFVNTYKPIGKPFKNR